MRRELLDAIQSNAKLSTTDLAVMIGANEAEIANELSEMTKQQIICGHHTLINWDKTNFDMVTALIEVKVVIQRGQGFDKIAERIYRFKEVKNFYLMSGGFDFTVVIEGRSMKEVALFVSQKLAILEGVVGTATHFVLKKYKDYGIILEEEKKDERMVVSP